MLFKRFRIGADFQPVRINDQHAGVVLKRLHRGRNRARQQRVVRIHHTDNLALRLAESADIRFDGSGALAEALSMDGDLDSDGQSDLWSGCSYYGVGGTVIGVPTAGL